MGEIKVKINLQNAVDRELFRAGLLDEKKVKSHSIEAVVDTGAVMLALSSDVVEKLKLSEQRKVVVSLADERKETMAVCGPVFLEIQGRSMYTECIVLPPASVPLIGQTVLETMDFLADCQNQKLTTRPESPIFPLLNLK